MADGLAAGEPVKVIAARIGKSVQRLYREIARNRKPDGTYQPWFAHNQARLRRRRPRQRILAQETSPAAIIAGKLAKRWSPEQISRWLRRHLPPTRRHGLRCDVAHRSDLSAQSGAAAGPKTALSSKTRVTKLVRFPTTTRPSQLPMQ